MEFTARDRRSHTESRASQQETVERAEAYVRAHLSTPVPVSKLSRIVGLSERGLRNAFYGVRGMSPKRRMLAVRLLSARHALAEANSHPTTVTGIATRYGFYELGRFAASYREAFGEVPSETLRSSSRKSSTQHSSRTRGHADACSR